MSDFWTSELRSSPVAPADRCPVPPSALCSASAPQGGKRPAHPDGAPTVHGSLVAVLSSTGRRARAGRRSLGLSKAPAGIDTPVHRAPLRSTAHLPITPC